jgi:voltage-gated potassium channel
MLVASVLVIPSVMIDVNDYQPPWSTVGVALNVGIWLAFLFEFVVMMMVVPSRSEWMRTHKLETFLVAASAPVLPAGFASLRLVRILRVSRLARLAKISRETFSMHGLPYVGLLAFLLVLASSEVFASVEHRSAGDGAWWAVSTVTTVGYGDVTPHTLAGRVLSVFVMLVGIGFAAFLTAAVAQKFIQYELGEDEGVDDAHRRHAEVVAHFESIHERLDALESARIGARLAATSKIETQ